MKTTEEMHQRYYDRFFEQTGLTFDEVPMHDVNVKVSSLKNRTNQDYTPAYKRVAIIRIYELFVESEEKRVNKKWRKRNGKRI